MKVTCNECGKKYLIDITKIVGDERSFACRGCQSLITVQKPIDETVESDALPVDEGMGAVLDDTLEMSENVVDETVESAGAALDETFETTEATFDEAFDDPLAELDALAAGAAAGADDVMSSEDSFADLDAELNSGDATADFILSDFDEDTESDSDTLFDDDLGFDNETSDELLDSASNLSSETETLDAEDEVDAVASEEEAPEAADSDDEVKISFWRGLTGKVVIAMLLVGILPLAGFGIASYMLTNQSLNKSASQVVERTAEGLKTQVEEWVDKNLKVIQAASIMPSFVDMDPDGQEIVLKAITEAYPWIYLAFTMDVDGVNIARSDDGQPEVFSYRKYYQEVVDGKQFSWQTVIGSNTGEPALVLSVPIREDGQLVGVVAAAMKIDDISQWVATWKEGQTGYAALIEDSGKIIVHPNNELAQLQWNLAGSGHALAQNFTKAQYGSTEFINEKGNKAFGTVTPTRHGWGLLIEQESDEVFAITRQLEPIFLAGLVIAAILAAIFGLIFARGIVRPVLSLSDAADRLSLGELDVTIDVNSKDEIGQLAKSITRMQDSLRIALEWLRSMK